jgi:hypothetical protein
MVERQGLWMRDWFVYFDFVVAVVAPAFLPLKVEHDVNVLYECCTFACSSCSPVVPSNEAMFWTTLNPLFFTLSRASFVLIPGKRLWTDGALFSCVRPSVWSIGDLGIP